MEEEVGRSAERAAAAAFGVVVAVAAMVILWTNRHQWFTRDEFDFLFARDITDPATLLTPHWGHLTALPAAVYQVLYRTIGLDNYLPYQLPVVVAHLAVAIQLRILMRRAGVHPWIATSAAGLVALFGAGRENMVWGFQLTLTGALAFGLASLLVADHADPTRRRLVLAAGLALAAVMCSNVGLVVVSVGAIALWVLHGRARALTVAAPGLVAYAAWRALAPASEPQIPPAGPDRAVRFAWSLTSETVQAMTGHPLAAVKATAVVLTGTVLVVKQVAAAPGTATPRHVIPLVLLLGALGMAGVLGVTRAGWIFNSPSTSRYLHMVAVLLAVPVALAVDELVARGARGPFIRRPQLAVVLGCALFAVGVPGNVDAIAPEDVSDRYSVGDRLFISHLAELASASDLPDDVRISPEITVGGLRQARADGHLTRGDEADAETRAEALLYLALEFVDTGPSTCAPIDAGVPATVRAGDVLESDAPLRTSLLVDGRRHGTQTWLGGSPPHRLRLRTGPHRLWIEPVETGAGVRRCR